MSLGAAFVRVSTGSQDETSQVKVIDDYAAQHGVTIVKTFKLHGYSASHGTQEPTWAMACASGVTRLGITAGVCHGAPWANASSRPRSMLPGWYPSAQISAARRRAAMVSSS